MKASYTLPNVSSDSSARRRSKHSSSVSSVLASSIIRLSALSKYSSFPSSIVVI